MEGMAGMIGLIVSLFTTLGATGLGSVLKMISGALDTRSQRLADEARLKLTHELRLRDEDKEYQKQLFGSSEAAALYGRHTRRTIAIIGVCNFAIITILCTIWPSCELTTFTIPEVREPFEFLFIKIPSSKPITVTLTTGHLALVGIHQLAIIFGFYFTPGGRLK